MDERHVKGGRYVSAAYRPQESRSKMSARMGTMPLQARSSCTLALSSLPPRMEQSTNSASTCELLTRGFFGLSMMMFQPVGREETDLVHCVCHSLPPDIAEKSLAKRGGGVGVKETAIPCPLIHRETDRRERHGLHKLDVSDY